MWQVGSACYSTELEAVAAMAAAESGSVKSTPAGLYSLSVASHDATSIEYALTAMDGGPSVANVLVPATPMPCGLLTTADAVELSGYVWGALAAVFAIKFLARPFVTSWRGDSNEV